MSVLDASSQPRLAAGVRLQHDRARAQWVLLAPERVIELDEIAHAIVSRCDGNRSLATIAAELAAEFEAEPDEVARDVCELAQQLHAKRLLRA
ncbi:MULTISPECIES: pyrroloquinoline quinone biosynthesis peptide chaperone PqqD [Xanthomonas]|uniref:PqqA binding protein n=1 Tax=Xanthomonas rydalmerensis TaxID=3046274 RepID=A0ABZ0JSM0_9XANT|nr:MULTISPECIES: pyrroloquinoline quinone biosynthesis peptide chaperone PqqD [unclassified Xanthomonas]MBB5942456.1 pyrroloquinoline quinone biosynthesis protein D [Xanthomonas sp. 3307]MXV08679.1 pyrroloquinoline quinone biosynthesis peptide chaperone PqqD [Xanthomonas sp. LMG 9002]WOS42018.1 pyrroloquinoline quinone biosynthesis peptide chaperone PqqD [Xanthomonas sp. DM-2023]WOS46203.1 pyrroloquinoline quinone biosynthesis peptide chaperone PqqD [Xanthomonas sp. DM-2023]WOS50382.1 pyrroloq